MYISMECGFEKEIKFRHCFSWLNIWFYPLICTMYIVHTNYNIADNVTSNHAANGFSTLTQRNVYLVERLDLVGTLRCQLNESTRLSF